MKPIRFSIFTLLIVLTCAAPDVFAQDWTQMRLPEGARARLGKGGVGEVKYSPDGNLLAVASAVGIWIYDARSFVELDLFTGHTEGITSIAFSPDGQTLASSSSDETVRLWDVATGRHKLTLTGHTRRIGSIAFRPDGSTLAGGGADATVHLWDSVSGAHKAMLTGHIHAISTVAFSPDGKTLASGAWDNTVRLWDVATGTQKAVLTEHAFFGENMSGISHVAFSADGKTLASAAFNEDRVRLSDPDTGAEKKILNTGNISSLTFNPNGRTLATGSRNGLLQLWDVASGERKTVLSGHASNINAIAFSTDGKTLVSGGGSQLLVWNARTGAQTGEINGHLRNGWRIAFTPDGSTLASVGDRPTVHLWDVANEQHKATLIGARVDDWVSAIAFSPEGSTLAGASGFRIWLWDVENRHLEAVVKGYTGSGVSGGGIRSVAFSPDGRFLASGSGHSDMKIQIWYGGRTHKATLTGHTGAITSIAFNPDSRTLASGSGDHTVRLWDIISETHINTLIGHTDRVNTVAFSPDGRTLASGSRDTTIFLWDAVTGAHKATLMGHIHSVENVAFSPDGRTLASGGGYDDRTLRLWDVDTGTHKMTLTGHTDSVVSVAFSPDGRTLATGSWDDTVLLWNITPEAAAQHIVEDVNRDGIVDLQDLRLVASRFGQHGSNEADINADGVVNIKDLVLVAGVLGTGDSAPTIMHRQSIETFTAADIRLWLSTAQQIDNATPVIQRGIATLEYLLTMLAPKETALLPNYPNPFNPETWIPYQLSEPADVTLHIYTADGVLVRTFKLGYQAAGIYKNRNRAVYWDGKNETGEPVASGIYFYTLSAGRHTTTRRMIIRK